MSQIDVQTTQRYAHIENIDVERKARDIMEQMGSKGDWLKLANLLAL